METMGIHGEEQFYRETQRRGDEGLGARRSAGPGDRREVPNEKRPGDSEASLVWDLSPIAHAAEGGTQPSVPMELHGPPC